MASSIFEISDRLTDEISALRPVLATYYGIEGFDGSWGDQTPRGWDELERLKRSALAEIEALPTSDDPWETLGVRVHVDYLKKGLRDIERGLMYRDLNSIASPIQFFRETFEMMDKTSLAGWDNILRRLQTFPGAAAGYIECLERGRSTGDVVARRQVVAVIDQVAGFAGPDSPLLGLVLQATEAGFDLETLESDIDTCRGGFGDLERYLRDVYLPDSRERDGCGEDEYVIEAASHLGMTINPQATYAWGWNEVLRLQRRLEQLAEEISGSPDVVATLKKLKESPEYAVSSHAAFVDVIRSRQESALRDLDGVHFDVPEQIREVDVQLAPRGGALGAYYTGPSEDFSRKGSIWYALGDQEGPVPLFDEISTAYHEGFPGHHLQVGVQVSLKDALTRMHRMLVWTPGYGEGWALYTEQLMDELGYFEKPEYVFGMVISQMHRAVRVVIDIGLHLDLPIPMDASFHPGEQWSFDIASDMLQTYAGLDTAYADSEIVRYLGWPGQAISYKMGERVILELREELRARPDFDLKRFHSAVLGFGPLGLAHLQEVVRAS